MSTIQYTITVKNYGEDAIEICKSNCFIGAVIRFVFAAYKCYIDTTKSFEYIKFDRTVLG